MTPLRTYRPGEPLFAQVPIRFGGVEYARGDALPDLHRSKHRALWRSGKASHERWGLFDRRGRLQRARPVVVDAPATVAPATSDSPRVTRSKRKR